MRGLGIALWQMNLRIIIVFMGGQFILCSFVAASELVTCRHAAPNEL
jgi:hypothetical protein